MTDETRFQRYRRLHREMEHMRAALWRSKHGDEIRRYDLHRRSQSAIIRSRREKQTTFESDAELTFVAFDGEGSHGRYQLLATSASEDVLRSERSLGTRDCLDFFAYLILAGAIRPSDAIVGFGLSYDFENILRDVTDDDYVSLRLGKVARYGSYDLKYVNRKFLDVSFHSEGRSYEYRLQDIYPYFQTSFVKACESRGIVLPEIVYEGKRQRGTFRYSDIDRISDYNRAELRAMVDLAGTLRQEFIGAFRAIDLVPKIDRRSWYGPGAQAGSVLDATSYTNLRANVPALSLATISAFSDSYAPLAAGERKTTGKTSAKTNRAYLSAMEHPFSVAYFGGRIEAAMRGRFDCTLYDYDLTSAYPYAITTLPTIADKKWERIDHLDERRRIGIYLIRWEGESECPYHPFPYRSRHGNVYFPSRGYGWVLSPEFYVASAGDTRVRVERGFVCDGTDGRGDGTGEGNSDLARLIARMGAERIRAKQSEEPAHRGLKLLMNSVYGKTLQKEGSRRFFNAFVAAWITSVTRARIYDLIATTKPGEVISVMTDGILSTVPLSATLTDALGGWTLTTYRSGYQFAPGVYRLERDNGTTLVHYRGFLRFDADKATQALDAGRTYIASNPVFVSRTMAIHDRSLRKKMYQFAPLLRSEQFSLASKRDMTQGVKMGEATYYPAKGSTEDQLYVSWPYDVYGTTNLQNILEEVSEGPND